MPLQSSMTAPDAQAQLGYVAPFFVVRDVMPSVAFYRDRLGFEVTFLGPDDGPYFAMLKRDGVRLMLKAVTPEVQPTPNRSRHHWARWDAYVYTPDPDALARSSHPEAFRSARHLASTRTNCAGSKSWMRTATFCTSGDRSSPLPSLPPTSTMARIRMCLRLHQTTSQRLERYSSAPIQSCESTTSRAVFSTTWTYSGSGTPSGAGRISHSLAATAPASISRRVIKGNPGTWVWVGVADVAALHHEYSRSGAFILEPPRNFPWPYEMKVADPDGHVLRFGSEPREDLPLER